LEGILIVDNHLLTKNGTAVIKLARMFLSMREGQRLKTVGEYADQLGMGRGTVQAAMKYLENSGAISISAKRRQGTYIEKINYVKLWDLADFKIITGVMPLPYSKRYEGMATGLYRTFDKAKVPFNLAYMRGGYRREQALLSGKYDFAVMSLLAAESLKESRKNVEIVVEFGEHSYVSGHKVLFSDPACTKIVDGMRVALDSTSADHLILTKCECQDKSVSFVELSYNQILDSLTQKNVDAAVWNIDEIIDRHLDVRYYDFQSPDAKELEVKATVAVIVTAKSRKGISNVLRQVIDRSLVVEIQQKVLRSELLPEY